MAAIGSFAFKPGKACLENEAQEVSNRQQKSTRDWREATDPKDNVRKVAAAIICDEARQRFLLERKVNHPNPRCDHRYCLVGGFRQHSDRSTTEAWKREATEEWADPASLGVALRMAELATPWRSFRFQGVEIPGRWEIDVLMIELESATFEQMTRTLLENNSSAHRPEGWPQVIEREALPRLPLLAGHDVVLEHFLASGSNKSEA